MTMFDNNQDDNHNQKQEWTHKFTWQRLKALAGEDVPDLDGGVCVARNQDVVSQLHPRGQTLDNKQESQHFGYTHS